MPVVAILPFTLLALLLVWLPLGWLTDVRYWWVVLGFGAAGLLLFVRSIQVLVLTPLLRARRPTAAEAEIIEPLWAQIAQANGLPASRYVVRVLPTDELNAFACGGHLVLVTSFAVHELSQAQLRGVLAHELSHHLGLHTVAITIGHWLSAPVVVLARVGFFLENVGHASAGSFGQKSPVVATVGKVVAIVMHALSWIFTAALRAAMPWRISSGTRRSSRPTAARCAWASAGNSRARCANCWHEARRGDRSAGGPAWPPRIHRRGPESPESKRSCAIRRAESRSAAPVVVRR